MININIQLREENGEIKVGISGSEVGESTELERNAALEIRKCLLNGIKVDENPS